jgi:hypothetical protein
MSNNVIPSIMEIRQSLEDLSPARRNRWQLKTLADDRFHLSKDSEGSFTLFIEGSRESFGRIPILTGIEYRDDARDLESQKTFGALRVTAPQSSFGPRAITHIAYELNERINGNSGVSNADLLQSSSWILRILGREPTVLSEQQQRGLIAECVLLTRLMSVARTLEVSSGQVLSKWMGPKGGKRDFASLDMAIEVKSTSRSTRTHHISSFDQVWPASETELVYLYSIGIRREPTVSRSLPDYVFDLVSQIVVASGEPDVTALDALWLSLSSAGYDKSHDDLYRSGGGFIPNPSLPPRLYRVGELDGLRLTSFRGDSLPSMVRSVSYDLEVGGEALSSTETQLALESFVTAPVLGIV